jgi:ribosomal protein S6--L-glutamate ligase
VKVAVAGIPGAWSTERMAESLRDCGLDAFVFSAGDLSHDLGTGTVQLDGRALGDLDAVVVKKLGDQSAAWARLRLHAFRALEARGVRVFSPADVIDVAMDRYRMMMVLAAAGVPVPDTIAAESRDAMVAAIRRFGDCIVKPVYTSKGRGMIRVQGDDTATIDRLLAEGGEQRYLVQRFVRAPGRDIGATVVGGRFVGAFYRVAREGEWMTTTAQGGTYAQCDLSPRGVELAERAACAFALDYTVVDLVEQGGDFLAYEVSAFGGFRGLLEATGVDPSVAYAHHVRRTLESV